MIRLNQLMSGQHSRSRCSWCFQQAWLQPMKLWLQTTGDVCRTSSRHLWSAGMPCLGRDRRRVPDCGMMRADFFAALLACFSGSLAGFSHVPLGSRNRLVSVFVGKYTTASTSQAPAPGSHPTTRMTFTQPCMFFSSRASVEEGVCDTLFSWNSTGCCTMSLYDMSVTRHTSGGDEVRFVCVSMTMKSPKWMTQG